jgi:hypothetical protein
MRAIVTAARSAVEHAVEQDGRLRVAARCRSAMLRLHSKVVVRHTIAIARRSRT